MTESIPLTTAKKTIMGKQSLKNRIKRENSDVPLFEHKVTILFLFSLSHSAKVVNTIYIYIYALMR